MMLSMEIVIVLISSFLLWAALLGVPYLVAKKVNQKAFTLAREAKSIVPPKANVHSVFIYTVVLFVLINLLLEVQGPRDLYGFKALVVILLTGFTYQTLKLFRK